MAIRLPIDDVLPQIIAAAMGGVPVVLKAPPGAGKTTGVPPGLLEHLDPREGQILLIQPRRLAARSAATRLASLIGGAVGDRVGYHVRFDRRQSPQTRLLVMTTGMLLQRLQSDPLLESAACVILDEFHERTLEMDLALGMIQRIRTTLRDDFRLIVMSATLEPQPIIDYLGDAVGVVSQGRLHRVDIHHDDVMTRDRIEHQVAAVMPRVLAQTGGNVLVFLPGVGEIRRVGAVLKRSGMTNDCDVLDLYGDLSPAQQDHVFAPSPRRKIILSTNIAETSVTIPGVTAVIDSGLARVLGFDARVGLPRLRLESISQAAAEQRAGRAGRTEPGVCYRLWTSTQHRSRIERDVPEIVRSDFSAAALRLVAWGERDWLGFPWLTPPGEAAVQSAWQLLRRLDAIDDRQRLTDHGIRMSRLPLHPRLSRLLIEAARYGVLRPAAITAALLTERDPFRVVTVTPPQRAVRSMLRTEPGGGVASSDLEGPIHTLMQLAAGTAAADPNIDAAAAKNVLRVADQLIKQFVQSDDPPAERDRFDADAVDRLTRSLLAAFPDRVAKRRGVGSDRGVMVGGRGVKLAASSKVRDAELFLCIDVDAGRDDADADVRKAAALDPSWFAGDQIRVVHDPIFHPTLRAIVTRRRVMLDDLILSEAPAPCVPDQRTAAMLIQQAKRHWHHAFPDDPELTQWIGRVRFLNRHAEHLKLPAIDEAIIDRVLHDLCQTRTSLAELKSAPWLDCLKATLGYEQLQTIQREAPTRMTVPSGNSIAITYHGDAPPTMSVKLQELFGWQQTPRLAGGKVPLRLELLGPNRRPEQVTDDLASFWANTYTQVRKDLRGRYPKHHWPEDPTTATATSRGMKPRG